MHRGRRILLQGGLLVIAIAAAVLLWPRPPAAATGAAGLSVGFIDACAVTVEGGAKCWGWNSVGQLGDGTTTNRAVPVDVCADATCQEPLSGVAAVAAGHGHTCALTTEGGVKCWGANSVGLLGDGTTTDSTTAVDVCADAGCDQLLSGVTAIDSWGGHTCAVTVAGGLKCWGDNSFGALGDGTTTHRATPVDVCADATCEEPLSGVAAVATGTGHACALTTAGALKCWGWNLSGQLGADTTEVCLDIDPCSTVPVDVSGLTSGVIAVAAGSHHTCAVTTAGGVKCWGSNTNGKLGVETAEICAGDPCATTPLDVAGLSSGVAAVTLGQRHTCALTTSAGVKCWGSNTNGKLGVETAEICAGDPCSTTPVDVSDLTSGVAAVGAGADHTCALTATGGVRCWGWNISGQLGDGTGVTSTSPVDVVGLEPKAALTGDVNCDGDINSIDAALVLQHGAGLIPSLACQDAANVNADGAINSIDAALILQYDAGLLLDLPP